MSLSERLEQVRDNLGNVDPVPADERASAPDQTPGKVIDVGPDPVVTFEDNFPESDVRSLLGSRTWVVRDMVRLSFGQMIEVDGVIFAHGANGVTKSWDQALQTTLNRRLERSPKTFWFPRIGYKRVMDEVGDFSTDSEASEVMGHFYLPNREGIHEEKGEWWHIMYLPDKHSDEKPGPEPALYPVSLEVPADNDLLAAAEEVFALYPNSQLAHVRDTLLANDRILRVLKGHLSPQITVEKTPSYDSEGGYSFGVGTAGGSS